MATPLCPADLLALSGADAIAFAHAQFTSDVATLAVGEWQWSAWLDAQGRVRCFFALLHVAPSQLVAWLPLGGAGPMRDALARFVFRAAVTLDASTWVLHALEESAVPLAAQSPRVIAHAGGYALRQPGTLERLAWLAPNAAPTDPLALDRWRLADIEAGLPLLAASLAGEFVAQALDLERLDAIRFDKGCYPGQEIAARLHFRGGNKRRLCRLVVADEMPAPGAAILAADGASIGRVLYSAARDPHHAGMLAVLGLPESHRPALATASGAHVDMN